MLGFLVEINEEIAMRPCSVPGCDKPHNARGYCKMHWHRMNLRGSPDEGVRPRGSLEERFWRKVAKAGPDDCWLWTGQILANGYGRISRGRKDEGADGAHRVSLEIALGHPISYDMVVMHLCDNPTCVNPAHLRVGTYAENTADMKAKGRHTVVAPVGNENGKALLTPELVRYIRASAGDKSMAEIARKLGVSKNTVRGVLIGRTWSHVT